MEWIKAILEKHTGEDGKLDLEGAQKEINAEFPKNAVPKADFNSKVEELKTANETLTTLQKDNKDVEKLQTTISEYKTQVEALEAERAEERKTYAVKEALQGAGGKDIDYLMFKLGDLELDKDGKVKDLDNKIKGLKEATPSFFESEEATPPADNKGYQVIDTKLDQGKQATIYSMDQLRTMTPEEINQNWDAVSASLEKGEDK